MFRDSINEQNWYFFAVTGINITVSLINCIQFNPEKAVRPEDSYKAKIDSHLLKQFKLFKSQKKTTVSDADWFYKSITKIYFQVFSDFNTYWVD